MSGNSSISKLKAFFDKLNPIKVTAPIKPKGRFPLIDAHDVLVDVKTNEAGDEIWVRLSDVVGGLGSGGAGDSAGVGIHDIYWVKDEEGFSYYNVLLTDTTTRELRVRNGSDGASIESIKHKETNGLVDTYEITFTDGRDPFKFTIKNGYAVTVEYDRTTESINIK